MSNQIPYSFDAVSLAPPAETSFCGLIAGGQFPFLSITGDLAAMLRKHGKDPADFNVMKWPTGASRHAHGRFLMRGQTLQEFIDAAGDTGQVFVLLGGVFFDRMTLLRPKPCFISEGSGPIFEVEVVDERYHWSGTKFNAFSNRGFNVSTLNKGGIFETTADPDNLVEGPDPEGPMVPGPWTLRRAFYRALELGDGDSWNRNEFAFETIVFDGFTDPGESTRWRDFNLGGISSPEVLDRLCAMAGRVLIAAPSVAYPQLRADGQTNDLVTYPSGGPRYYAVPIEIGDPYAAQFVQTYAEEGVRGGFHTAAEDWIDPGSGAFVGAMTPLSVLQPHVPAAVEVIFPLWTRTGQGWNFDSAEEGEAPAGTFALDRYQSHLSSSGRPGSGGSGIETIPSTFYGIVDPEIGTIDNDDDLLAEADVLANVYFARFRAGSCDVTIRGLKNVVQWPGASMLVWRLREGVPETSAIGAPDDPIFGWRQDRPLTASMIESVGTVRATPRPFGGVLLDSPAPPGRLWLGRVTKVTPDGSGLNASYDVEAIDSPCENDDPATGICIIGGEPERYFDVTKIDIEPASVGDYCIIGDPTGAPGDRVFWLAERPRMIDCDDVAPPADQASQAGPGLPRGADPRIISIHGL